MALTLESLLLAVGRSLAPLAQRLEDDEIAPLFADLGLPSPDIVLGTPAVTTAVGTAASAVSGLPAVLPELAAAIDARDGMRIAAAVAAVVPIVRSVAGAFDTVSTAIHAAATSAGPHRAEVEAFAAELAQRLFGYAIVTSLERHQPLLAKLLDVAGILESTALAATPAAPAYTRRVLRPDRVTAWFRDPVGVLADLYGWGTPQFDGDEVLRRLSDLLDSVTWFAFVHPGPPPFLRVAGIDIGPTADPVPGVGASLRIAGSEGLNLSVPVGETMALIVAADAALDEKAAVKLLPPAVVQVVPPTSEVRGKVRFGLQAPSAPGGLPLVIAGTAGGSRIEGRALRATAGADLEWDVLNERADGDLVLEVAVEGGKIVLDLADADGFLAAILPATIELDADLNLSWSPTTGLHFKGSTGIEVNLPVSLDLGLAIVTGLRVALLLAGTEAGPEVAVRAVAAVSGGLGPFSYAADRLGVELAVVFGSGNAGPFDVQLRPVWPNGLGLAIDLPAVSGGGFLRFDPAAGRYAGVFELTIAGSIAVKAIGLITTRLPGGRPGFALLLMITADGFTPIQLGLGFTLTGIGGLIALNRSVDADAVRAGLGSGVLDSVLFANDPVANADRILATLDRIFPTAADRLLVGPLAEISWGSPTLVTARLALLLELPQPVRAVVLATVDALLPGPADPVVELHIDAIGVLDLGRGELALDASLHHSRLAGYTLSGDLAARLNWGDDPLLLISVGGFHPRFNPPAGLRPLRRLTMSLSDRDNPRIRFESYLALTSNTIQFGARAAVRAEAGGFGVDGGGSFDALVQWSPFGIDLAFEAWVKVFSPAGTLCSARLSVAVTGPRPWHVAGVLTVHLLFFSIHAGVDFTIGTPQPPQPVDTVDLLALLGRELTRPASWSAVLPRSGTPGVTLRPPTGPDGPLVVHPLGTITVRQKLVPLDTPVTRYGAARPKDGPRTYGLDVHSPTGITAQPLLERFAPAQYSDQSDDQKLAAPAFTLRPAGLSFQPTTDNAPVQLQVAIDLTFETVDLTELA